MHDPHWRRYGDRSRAARIRRLFDERMAIVYKNADVPGRRHKKGMDFSGSEYHIEGTRGNWMRTALNESLRTRKMQSRTDEGTAFYNDTDFREGCREFGYDVGTWMCAGNSYNDLRKEIASCYLSAGNECAAARVLFGRSLNPNGYSWILENIARHDLVSNPYDSARQMDAYVQKFMIIK